MDVPNNLIIRRYNPDDRQAIRRIAYETSFLGKPELFLKDQEIVSDALTMYFTDFEPESCFVAVSPEGVVGYLTGTRDAHKMSRVVQSKIIWRLLRKILKKRLVFNVPWLKFMLNFGASFLAGEFSSPKDIRQYPALFHINLDPHVRGLGHGASLIKSFENDLISKGIRGVHVGTMSEQAKAFFMKNGYGILSQSRRSYLRYQLNRVIPYYILGKKLSTPGGA